MNHTYRLVWNEAAQRYVPAAESARSRGKSGGRKAQRRLRTIVLVASVGGAYVGSALAGPMQICTSLERKVVVATGGQICVWADAATLGCSIECEVPWPHARSRFEGTTGSSQLDTSTWTPSL